MHCRLSEQKKRTHYLSKRTAIGSGSMSPPLVVKRKHADKFTNEEFVDMHPSQKKELKPCRHCGVGNRYPSVGIPCNYYFPLDLLDAHVEKEHPEVLTKPAPVGPLQQILMMQARADAEASKKRVPSDSIGPVEVKRTRYSDKTKSLSSSIARSIDWVLVRFDTLMWETDSLSGLFVADRLEVVWAWGEEVCFGKILGKDDNVVLTLGKNDMKIVNCDEDKIEWLRSISFYDGKGHYNIVGYNPLGYLDFEGYLKTVREEEEKRRETNKGSITSEDDEDKTISFPVSEEEEEEEEE